MYKKVQEFYKNQPAVDDEIEKNVQKFRQDLEEQFKMASEYQPKVDKSWNCVFFFYKWL